MNPKQLKQEIDRAVGREAEALAEISLAIHRLAEPACGEVRSCRLLADYLKAAGFRIEFPFRSLPTAFRATWGKGRPVIGMLGEYDALPDCGAEDGAWGHGCGHNLLGTAPAGGVVAAKSVMERHGVKGRIVYYGCPAEETLVGKVYMARDGAFRELDACLGWHPSTRTEVNNVGGAAMDSLVFEFFGRTAHAGASPHRGRSALDAAILLDVAANYLREHVPEHSRIHSVIRDGGNAPNVVPAYSRIWYFVRGANRAEVDELRNRLLACARGAAEATGTTMKWKRLTGVYERLPNDLLTGVVDGNLRMFGAPKATQKDKQRVRALGLKPILDSAVHGGKESPGRGSSDESNVSWLVPFGRFQMSCYAQGTPGHHRHLAAQAAMPFAQRGLLQTAKVLAGTAVSLCVSPKLVAKAKAEFRKRLNGRSYDPLLPKNQKPPTESP